MASRYLCSRMRICPSVFSGLTKCWVHVQGAADVIFGVAQSTIGVTKVKFAGAEEEVDGGSEVESLDVLVIQLDGPPAVVERQPGLALEEVLPSDVVLSLTLPLRVEPRSARALSPARRTSDAERKEPDEPSYFEKLQKRHTLLRDRAYPSSARLVNVRLEGRWTADTFALPSSGVVTVHEYGSSPRRRHRSVSTDHRPSRAERRCI